jgi:GT2 family glycosyltransferase
MEPLIARTDVFATDARQFNWDGQKEIHLATRLRPRTLLASYRRPGILPLLDCPQESAQEPVEEVQACSAAMAVRRAMFERLGGFDERLIVSWEDTEICWRAWLRKWPTLFVPAAICWHRIGGSTRNRPEESTRLRGIVGGRLLFATKHLPVWHAANTWIVSCLGLARDVLSARFGLAASKAHILLDCARLVPTVLAERHEICRSGITY